MPSPYDLKDNASGQSEDASMAVNLTGLPPSLFEKYSKGPTAQLMPADPKKGYATPYYAAYTNDGDIAGAVMVAEGQKVRLVDKMTGEVVFEGIGPEGARLATSAANAISQDLGRTAAWAIQKPTDEGGWVSMAEERWDPEKQGFLGKLADIALPILGTLLMPVLGPLGPIISAGLGAAAGSTLSSVAQGRPLDETVKRAAIAGVTGGIGAKVAPMIGSALAKAPENAVTNALNTGYSAVMNPLNAGVNAVRGAAGTAGNIIKGGLNAAGEVIVTPSVTSALTGGALGSVTGSTAGAALTGSSGQPAMRGDAGGDTLNQGNTVEGVDVIGSNADAATGGALGSVAGTIGDYTQVGGEYKPVGGEEPVVGEVVVEGQKPGLATPVSDLDSSQVMQGVEKAIGSDTPTAEELLDSKPGLSTRLIEWVKANPGLAARMGLTLAGLTGATGGSGGSTKGGGIPPGFATAGTPGSLSDKFRAQLPAPSGPFTNLASRDVSMTPEEWKTYGARPEQSFFANVPIRPSGIIDTSKRAPVNPGLNPAEAEPGFKAKVNPDVRVAPGYWPEPNSPGFNPTAPSSVNSTSGSDMNRGSMTAEQFAVAMKRMEDARQAQPMPAPSKGFKVGGFAVSGPGTGRSDDIPARLSDGEYVIDAETVALLGDGSSQAGSKRLDEFRANIRKHKGRQLAKGKFSHDARKPEAYLQGGQV